MEKNRRVFIIAEAGVNHNGDIAIAKKMVDVAARAGADAVKFQTFTPESLTSVHAPKAQYQKKAACDNESQLEMLRRLHLDRDAHNELIQYCRCKGITFLSSPFDMESIDFLYGLGLRVFKIPSGEIVNRPYLHKIGTLRGRVILSTGMATLQEIREALRIIVKAGTPKNRITVLHCNTSYPTRSEDVNLRALVTIRQELRVAVGYSDHSVGIEVPVAAVALGAEVVEKHFTLDKTMEGPDHAASLDPDELQHMVRAIRNIEKALGTGRKKPTASELQNIKSVRKSLVARRNIAKGEVFTVDNIAAKRPGNGLSPMKWNNVLGRKAVRNFKRDELICI